MESLERQRGNVRVIVVDCIMDDPECWAECWAERLELPPELVKSLSADFSRRDPRQQGIYSQTDA